MGRTRSAEEIKAECIEHFGEPLGSLYFAVQNQVIWLHAKWREYRSLYAVSPEDIQILNDTAPFFFFMLHDVLWHDVVLSIARLNDPPETSGRENLSFRRLILTVDRPQVKHQLEEVLKAIKPALDKVRRARNKYISHNDLSHALGERDLPSPGSRKAIEGILECFRSILDQLRRAYLPEQEDVEMDYQRPAVVGDAETLVNHLRWAAAQTERWETL